MLQILEAKETDADNLTQITMRSKGYWGYTMDQMKAWEADLTISPNYIQDNSVFKLLEDDVVVGYYSYFPTAPETIKLDNLFILPEQIGKGFGKYLLDDLSTRARNLGYRSILVDSDPHATVFYQKMGFRIINQLESSIKNRFLPIMEKVIIPDKNAI